MQIYNSLTRKKEEFVPNEAGKVSMYTCGPTVYHFAHIGNLRSYIMEDVLEKYLRYSGLDVKRVMNITDVGHLSSDADTGEDKMLKGAKQCIPEFISTIEALIEKGYAYEAGGNIYFDTSKLEQYYVFNDFKEEDLEVGVREGVEEDTNKKNKADFVLWFTKSKFDSQELKWDSPWGIGYPGWHIECSCISMKHLGEYLDLHCGGIDNAFPHHTNEIAQSEAFVGHKWCNYWFHVHHLNTNSGKMSKSKGEFLTVSLLESKGYDPLVYRFFCLQSHYRKSLVFSYENLDNAAIAYNKLVARIAALMNGDKGEIDSAAFDSLKAGFVSALDNDLNTSLAVTALYDVLKADTTPATKLALIEDFDRVLCVGLIAAAEKVNSANESAEPDVDSELITYINDMIAQRVAAKKEKNFARADEIRAELLSKGITLIDTREGTKFEINK